MRRLLVVAGIALVVGSIMSSAWGKGGPVKATLKGPGLDEPVTFGGGERSGRKIMMLAERSGLFPALYVQYPSPMEYQRPTKELGPRYTLNYVIPAPAPGSATVNQYVYPYAQGRPVTYTPAGQPVGGDDGDNGRSLQTEGGWYQATSLLKSTLVSAGLPSEPPTSSSEIPAETSRSLAVWLAAGSVLVLGAGLIVVVAIRRRGLLSTQQGAA